MAGTGLVADQAADIDGAGGPGDREEAPAVDCLADRDVDGIYAQEGSLRAVEVVGRCADIEVVVAVGRGVVQDTEVGVKVVDGNKFGVDGFGRRAKEGAVELEAVFKSEAGAVEALVGVGALEPDTDGMIAVFIQGFVIGGGEGEIVTR